MLQTKHLILFALLLAFHMMEAQDTTQIREEAVRHPPEWMESHHVQVFHSKVWHGKFRYIYNGVVVMEGNYSQGLMDGEWKYFYPDGKLKNQVVYSKGIWQRSLGAFYNNGKKLFTDSISGEKEYRQTYTDKSELSKLSILEKGNWVQTSRFDPHTQKLTEKLVPDDKDTALVKVTTFYKNGQVRSVLLTKHGLPFTAVEAFGYDGKPLDQGDLKEGKGSLRTYQDSSVVLHASDISYQYGKKNGPATIYQLNGKLGKQGQYDDQWATGQWVYFTKKGRKAYELLADRPSTKKKKNKKIIFYSEKEDYAGEISPDYIGGEASLMRFLRDNIRYPAEEKDNGIMGTVVMTFVIKADGSLGDVKPLKTVLNGNGLTTETIRVVKEMPRWMPGFVDGKPVAVQYNLPVSFVLR
jgi:protein TonB